MGLRNMVAHRPAGLFMHHGLLSRLCPAYFALPLLAKPRASSSAYGAWTMAGLLNGYPPYGRPTSSVEPSVLPPTVLPSAL